MNNYLIDWMYYWLEIYAKMNIKYRTYSRYKDIIELHIASYWRGKSLNEITADRVQEFVAYKLEHGNLLTGKCLAASSVNTIITVFREAINIAEELGNIDNNPFEKIKKPPHKEIEAKAFFGKEQRRLESYIRNADDPKLIGIFICLYTGIRIGELLALKWKDIDFQSELMHITKTVCRIKDNEGKYFLYTDKPKTKSSKRDIPMPDMLKIMLKAHKLQSKGAYVISNKEGKQMSIRSYQYIFEQLQKRSGVEMLSFHSLRHTFATRALECGMDYKTLSEIMGHSDPAFTIKRYGHSMMVHKKKMMNRLGKFFD